MSADCDFGPREILTGDLADFLVSPESIEGYVGAIRRALREYPDPTPDFFARFQVDEVLRCYGERYRTAILARKEA